MSRRVNLFSRISSLISRQNPSKAPKEFAIISQEELEITKRDVRVMGADYLGNYYYERDKGVDRVKRWYLPKDQDDWDRPIPPEWEAWLRYRRDDAPTCDEINLNIALAELKKIRAKELEMKEKGTLHLTQSTSPSTLTSTEKPSDTSEGGKKREWPKYDDIPAGYH